MIRLNELFFAFCLGATILSSSALAAQARKAAIQQPQRAKVLALGDSIQSRITKQCGESFFLFDGGGSVEFQGTRSVYRTISYHPPQEIDRINYPDYQGWYNIKYTINYGIHRHYYDRAPLSQGWLRDDDFSGRKTLWYGSASDKRQIDILSLSFRVSSNSDPVIVLAKQYGRTANHFGINLPPENEGGGGTSFYETKDGSLDFPVAEKGDTMTMAWSFFITNPSAFVPLTCQDIQKPEIFSAKIFFSPKNDYTTHLLKSLNRHRIDDRYTEAMLYGRNVYSKVWHEYASNAQTEETLQATQNIDTGNRIGLDIAEGIFKLYDDENNIYRAVYVTNVHHNSSAFGKLQPGDVIFFMNSNPINNASDASKFVKSVAKGKYYRVHYGRYEQQSYGKVLVYHYTDLPYRSDL